MIRWIIRTAGLSRSFEAEGYDGRFVSFIERTDCEKVGRDLL